MRRWLIVLVVAAGCGEMADMDAPGLAVGTWYSGGEALTMLPGGAYQLSDGGSHFDVGIWGTEAGVLRMQSWCTGEWTLKPYHQDADRLELGGVTWQRRVPAGAVPKDTRGINTLGRALCRPAVEP